jgi:hypothetical protein
MLGSTIQNLVSLCVLSVAAAIGLENHDHAKRVGKKLKLQQRHEEQWR